MQPPIKSAALHLKLVRIAICLRAACYEALSARALASYGARTDSNASDRRRGIDKHESADTARE